MNAWWRGRGRDRQLVPEGRVDDPQAGGERSPVPDDFYTLHTPQEKAKGRGKRGRLPDPDRRQQGREPPPGWGSGGGFYRQRF